MLVNKTAINNVRNSVKALIKEIDATLNILKKALESTDLFDDPETTLEDRTNIIGTLNSVCDSSFRFMDSDAFIRTTIKDSMKYYEIMKRKYQTLIDGLSFDGIHKVTYGLPLLTISCFGRNLSYPYLMITGIKTNAQLKSQNDELFKNGESALFLKEIELAQYIDDNYRINIDEVEKFIDCYKEYIEAFYHNKNHSYERRLEEIMDKILLPMALYVIYTETGLEKINDIAYSDICLRYKAYQVINKMTPGEAIKYLVDSLIKLIEIRKDEEALNSTPNVEEIFLNEYFDGEIVIKPCNLEIFKSLLDGLEFTDNEKEYYFGLMEAYWREVAQEEYNNRIEKARSELLSSKKIELYNLGRLRSDCSSIIDDIDALIEMSLDEMPMENSAILLRELEEQMRKLEDFLNYRREVVEDRDLVYFMEEIPNESGENIRIPRILRSILSNKNKHLFPTRLLLRNLLNGNTTKDRALKTENLPCKIWINGRNFKLFYTIIEGVVVVIDGLSEEQGYSSVIDLVRSEAFIDFMNLVRENIKLNKKICASGYTALIMEASDKSGLLSKRISLS